MESVAKSSSRLRPAAHFLLLGGALLLGVTLLSGSPPSEVVFTAERVAQLQAEWQRHLGRPPTSEEEDTLLAKAVEDELFFAEAMHRGLHHEDLRVRERLESLASFAGEEPTTDLVDAALALDLHLRDALVHGWLVDLGKQAALRDSDLGAADEKRREEALKRLRQKFRVRIERPAEVVP